MITAAPYTVAPARLLDAFPLIRSNNLDEASDRIGRVFSPHRLELAGASDRLDVTHNQVRLQNISLNVLHYGAEVVIDPGERGDFYMLQLPLEGSAFLRCGREEVRTDEAMLSVLPPQTRSRMVWSGNCTMILVQVPQQLVHERARACGLSGTPRFALAHSRQLPEVGALWQAAVDLTCNFDRFGSLWLQHPAACASMEEFLLSAFTTLLSRHDDGPRYVDKGDERCLRRAKEFIHSNLDRALSATEIAQHACVSPRTLEAVFKRHGEAPPLAYARHRRLLAVHDVLRQAGRQRRVVNVTEVALNHGFLHMGRFAAQYRSEFGCSPSETARPH